MQTLLPFSFQINRRINFQDFVGFLSVFFNIFNTVVFIVFDDLIPQGVTWIPFCMNIDAFCFCTT
eukprot:14062.XXX_979322_979516_1 [CDS] Oithona nana genome sequencing.